MPLPEDRTVLLARLREAHHKLDAEFDRVPAGAEREATIEGDVSVCDVVAYQIGWGRLLLGWDAAEQRGETPELPAPGYQWNQLGELAASFYEAAADRDFAELRAEWTLVVDELAEWIESLDAATLFETSRRAWAGDKWPLVKWIQVNTIAPYQSARTKVRRWLRERGG